MLGALYGLFSLIVVPIFILVSIMSPKGSGVGIFFIILLPILYAVLGFIGGVISAAIYNLVAGWIGGIEFTTAEVPSQQIV